MNKTVIAKKLGGLLAATLLLSSTFEASGGPIENVPLDKTVVENPKPGNPLSFFDGRLVLDVEERLRYEYRENNFDFNSDFSSPTDEHLLLQRFRLGIKVKPSDWLTFYVQMQSAQELSRRPNVPGALGAEGDVNFDFRNLYIEFANYKEFPVGLQLGRQVMNYGDERLIGGFDWNNIGRTFDAARIHVKSDTWWFDAFSSSVVTINRDVVNFSDLFNWDDANRGMVFSGAYFSTTELPKVTTDLYMLILNMKQGTNTSFMPTPGSILGLAAGGQGGNVAARTDFVTLGTRVKSNPKDWDGFEFDTELAFQIGSVQALDLMAFAAHAGAGYTFDLPLKPRVYVEYSYASGDSNPTDQDDNTFQNLFPTNHKFYGYMDLFSWQNIHNPAIYTRITPMENLTLNADFHMFWLATTEDAWYRANGLTRVRPITPGASSFVGSEIDLTANWKPFECLGFGVGYSHFFAGQYVDDTGPASDADFVYVQASVKF